jgi:cell division protein FtsB
MEFLRAPDLKPGAGKAVNQRVMTVRHLLTALFAGLAIYLVLVLLDGPFSPRKQLLLEEYREDLAANLEELEAVGDALEARYYELRDDPAAIIREANRIGMSFPSEMMMQEFGRQRAVESLSPGQLLLLNTARVENYRTFRAVALSASLIILVLLMIFDPPETSRGRRRSPAAKPEDRTAGASPAPGLGSVGSDLEMGQSMRLHVAARE